VNAAEARRRAEEWAAADPDPQTAEELRTLLGRGDDAELIERFEQALEFGTAGLRGVLGAGPNRMNRAVVRRTTAGFARYLKAHVPEAARRGVVVGRDGRRMSREFAQDSAAVLAAEGIRALVFPDVVPTPVVAFAAVHLNAAGAVMITASHNPPEYNGYKVYWTNGAQIIPPHDLGIAAAMEGVESANKVPLLPAAEARRLDRWSDLSPEVGQAYLQAILRHQLHPEAPRDLNIVYTAMHGVGGRWFDAAMEAAGMRRIHRVSEQHEPDPNFPTVRFPNPEEPGAMDLSRALADKVNADLVLANDPDADRLAVMARDEQGRLVALTGNEVGVLLGHYLLTQSKPAGRPLMISTIVSSPQLGQIVSGLGALYEETLTGFKWIANRALQLEREQGAQFLFGYEEALGYTVGTAVRDKDGIGTALAVVDLACWCRSRKVTVLAYLEEIQRRYGLFVAEQKSFTFPGSEGAAVIAGIMNAFRRDPPSRIGELEVIDVKDYLAQQARSGGNTRSLSLPPSNVIAYELANGSRITLRPSGTEPKIKYYFEWREGMKQDEPITLARQRATQKLQELETAFVNLARKRGQP
jgi:phosphomannomutase